MSLRVRTALSLLVALALFGCAPRRESVREELVRRQKETGLSLAGVRNNKIYAVTFADRSVRETRTFLDIGTAISGAISPDGTEIAFDLCPEPGAAHPKPNIAVCPAGATHLVVMRADGTSVQDYPFLAFPSGECWFSDESKLAMTVSNRKKNKYADDTLRVLNVASGDTEEIDGRHTFVSSQCWSPGGKRLVYTVNKPRGIQIVRLYDTAQKKSSELAKGGYPTWSPDGEWIAYEECPPTLENCTYYAIRPDGGERKMLFHVWSQGSELWWSPDSHFVAYRSLRSFLEKAPLLLTTEVWRLRVRHVEDNSEDWVANISGHEPLEYQWVTSAEIGKH